MRSGSRKPFRERLPNFILAGAFIAGFWWFLFYSGLMLATQSRNAPNRAAILRIHQELEIGMSQDQVRAVYNRARSMSLRLLEPRSGEWFITMPMEFGATDWRLRLEFQTNALTAIQLRTADGPPPDDSPPDKISPATH